MSCREASEADGSVIRLAAVGRREVGRAGYIAGVPP